MIRAIQSIQRVAPVAILLVLAACSARPGADEVRQVLQQNLPDALRDNVVVDQVQSQITAEGDSVVVKFKSQLKTTQPLYAPVDPKKAAAIAGADVSLFGEVDRAVSNLSTRLRQDFQADISKIKQVPTFIEETSAAGTSVDWYGSYRAKQVVDRWVVSDFKTEVQPLLKGMPRQTFAADALSTDKVASWFDDRKRDQQAFLQRVADAQKLQETEQQLAAVQAVAAQEKATREHADRRMPINVTVRPATLGGTMVVRFQVLRPMSVTMEVSRGLQHFSRDLQLAPGRTLEFGHLEGWGFRSGDQVTLTHPSFDTVSFSIR
jgi:hypothetical protein